MRVAMAEIARKNSKCGHEAPFQLGRYGLVEEAFVPLTNNSRLRHRSINAQRFNADRPESRSALGSFFAKRGRSADAEASCSA